MQKIIAALPGTLIVAGCVALAYGAGLLHPAAGWIAGGALALVYSARAARPRAEMGRQLMQKIAAVLPDTLIVAGCAGLAYGAGLLHPAAGWIAGGALALVFGVLGAAKGGK